MPEIVRHDGSIVADDWQVLEHPAEGEALELPQGRCLVPAALWLAGQEQYAGNPDIGLWLDSHEEPELIAEHVSELPLIAVNFPKFSDGRGYSSACCASGLATGVNSGPSVMCCWISSSS